jgi:hypothetical protein
VKLALGGTGESSDGDTGGNREPSWCELPLGPSNWYQQALDSEAFRAE